MDALCPICRTRNLRAYNRFPENVCTQCGVHLGTEELAEVRERLAITRGGKVWLAAVASIATSAVWVTALYFILSKPV